MKIYIISDTHFNHESIISFCGRPKDHEQRLIDSMYSVKPEDCLIHLGDICFGQNDFINKVLIGSLKCRKILVMGNHDEKSWSWYMEHGWDFVCDTFRLKYAGKIILFSHKPEPWDGIWDVNIHGHLHNLGYEKRGLKPLADLYKLYAPELMDYKVVELAQFIQTGG